MHVLDAGILQFPHRHLIAQVGLNFVCQFLEKSTGGTATSGACRDHRCKRSQAHGLQNLLCDDDFPRAVATGFWRKRDADRVTDAFLQQNSQRRSRGDNTFATHAGFGQTEVQWIIATARQIAINGNQILHRAHFTAQDYFVAAQTQRFGFCSAFKCRHNQRLAHHDISFLWCIAPGVFVHHSGDQFRVERSPVHAYAHWFIKLDGSHDHRAELVVAFAALPNVTGIDTQLCQCFRAVRHFSQQFVAVEMEVAHQRNIDAHRIQFSANLVNGTRRAKRIDGNAYHLRTRTRQCRYLGNSGGNILGIGVSHRLHQDRRIAAYGQVADFDLPRLAAINF